MVFNILNGDSTLYNFNQAGMPGEFMVWREVLSEGPVTADLSYTDFFAVRAEWISNTFNSAPPEYQTKVVKEFERLKDLSTFQELILWFEYDLHCQVNLIFLLDYFYKARVKNKILLICPASHPNHLDFRGIGQLSPQEFAELPAQRILLNNKDLAIASNAWKTYCSGNQQLIKDFSAEDHGQLQHLKPALLAHLNRFTDEATGLNGIECKLLSIINSGISKKEDIYLAFWKMNPIYGMGDSQIDMYIKRLAQLNLIPQNLI